MTTLTLRAEQQAVHNYLITRTHCAIWLKMSAGKTATTLAALNTIQPAGHILVVAPPKVARNTWISEIEKFGFNIRTRSLIVNEADRKLTRAARLARFAETLTDEPTMYFISHDLLSQPPRANCAHCQGAPARGAVCTHCQGGLIDQMPRIGSGNTAQVQWPFPTVIIDESDGFKSHSSRRFKALAAMRPAITLSATGEN